MVGYHWRAEQARTIVKPFVMQHMEDNNSTKPSTMQVRTKLRDLTAEDNTFDLTTKLLTDCKKKEHNGNSFLQQLLTLQKIIRHSKSLKMERG